MIAFRHELEALLNRHSMEQGSDTPDFILAQYLADCLAAFDTATRARESWYGHRRRRRKPRAISALPVLTPVDAHLDTEDQ